MRYSAEPKYRKYVKDMAFCRSQENLVINMAKKINGYCNKNRNWRSKNSF